MQTAHEPGELGSAEVTRGLIEGLTCHEPHLQTELPLLRL